MRELYIIIATICQITGMNPEIEVREKYELIVDKGTIKKGAVRKEPTKYVITLFYSDYFDPSDKATTKKVLIHELIHVWQMEQGKLQIIKGNLIVWKGDTMNITDTFYFDREFEKEAKMLENILVKRL